MIFIQLNEYAYVNIYIYLSMNLIFYIAALELNKQNAE